MDRAARLAELSDVLVTTARQVKVLSALSLPASAADEFLTTWRAGSPRAPQPTGHLKDAAQLQATLRQLVSACDLSDPIGSYLAQTATSYRLAIDLVERVGTPKFYELSKELYGSASGRLRGSTLRHCDAAEQLLKSSSVMASAIHQTEDDYCLRAEYVAAQLDREWGEFFDTPMRIEVDPSLNAKAAASATRVRLRGATPFTEQDIAQLSAHEVGVHSLTARNGRAQSTLRALGLGAPRTTATQEGLATFAELITDAMDLSRLRRLALRIRAVGLVEDGADFVQLFEHLVEYGETPTEAALTTMRVFRGADPRGGYPFTKDVVYLQGLFAVHTFLRRAIAEHRPELVGRLFVGRLTLSDAVHFEEDFGGLIDEPRFLPSWASRLPSLAAYLAFSALMNEVDIGAVELGS